MNAMQNMQSWQQIAEAHARQLQKLVPAFDNLYNAMPEQQKKLTDQVFRANAERHEAAIAPWSKRWSDSKMTPVCARAPSVSVLGAAVAS
jgi:hypothetical protein